MISKEQINQIIPNIELASKNNNTDLFSKTRDVFQARLDTYIKISCQHKKITIYWYVEGGKYGSVKTN